MLLYYANDKDLVNCVKCFRQGKFVFVGPGPEECGTFSLEIHDNLIGRGLRAGFSDF